MPATQRVQLGCPAEFQGWSRHTRMMNFAYPDRHGVTARNRAPLAATAGQWAAVESRGLKMPGARRAGGLSGGRKLKRLCGWNASIVPRACRAALRTVPGSYNRAGSGSRPCDSMPKPSAKVLAGIVGRRSNGPSRHGTRLRLRRVAHCLPDSVNAPLLGSAVSC
jgi:hypothetical protein